MPRCAEPKRERRELRELVLGEERLAREAQGFSFVERRLWRRVRVSGPLTAVLALEERDRGGAAEEPLDEHEEDEQPEELEP